MMFLAHVMENLAAQDASIPTLSCITHIKNWITCCPMIPDEVSILHETSDVITTDIAKNVVCLCRCQAGLLAMSIITSNNAVLLNKSTSGFPSFLHLVMIVHLILCTRRTSQLHFCSNDYGSSLLLR